MNAPHIGYYLHFPSNSGGSYELVIGFYKDRHKFFLLDNKRTPSKYRDLTFAYYDLSMPLLFWVNDNEDTLFKILFLDEILIEEKPKTNNALYILSGNTNAFPYLQENGENVISKYDYTDIEKKYIKLYIERLYLNRRISEIDKSNMHSYELAKDAHIQKIKEGIDYVLRLDIDKILSRLSIIVWDRHRTKIGGDDTYWVYQLTSIEDKTLYIDEYLTSLFQLGEKCIIEESGYTSYFPHPEIIFGKYDEDHLKPIREEYKGKYSKIEHLFWYYQNNRDTITAESINTTNYKKRIDEITNEIKKLIFDINELHKRLDERFFYDINRSWVNTHNHISELNEFVSRIQCLKPKMRIIISGFVTDSEKPQAEKSIHNLMDDLIRDKDLTLITGNAKGGENIALNYALEKKISFVNEYTKWTMLGEDRRMKRYQEMTQDVDLICLIGDSNNYLYKNFLDIAEQNNIQVLLLTL